MVTCHPLSACASGVIQRLANDRQGSYQCAISDCGFRNVRFAIPGSYWRICQLLDGNLGSMPFPAPTNFGAVEREARTVRDWLPDAEALAGTTRALKEYLGFFVYQVRGWL